MHHRDRAQMRASRSVPGENPWEGGAATARVAGREALWAGDERVNVARPVSLPVRGDVRALVPVTFGPHAPILKRVIRSPYALPTGKVERVQLVEASGRDRDPVTRVATAPQLVREDLRIAPFPSPMRTMDHAVHLRAHPFARARRALVESAGAIAAGGPADE